MLLKGKISLAKGTVLLLRDFPIGLTSLRVCQTEDWAQLVLGGGGGVEWCSRDEEWTNLELLPTDLGGALGVATLIVSWG